MAARTDFTFQDFQAAILLACDGPKVLQTKSSLPIVNIPKNTSTPNQDADTPLTYKTLLKDTLLGNLVSLFEKYLVLRIPSLSKDGTCIARDALGHILGDTLLVYCQKIKYFQPDDLWKLLPTIMGSSLWPTNLIKVVEGNYSCTIEKLMFEEGLCVQICYFGEFLYYCTTNIDSYVKTIKKSATPSETSLLDDIERTISPRLGLWTFIIIRNSLMANYSLKYQERILAFCSTVEKSPGFSSFHSRYCKSLSAVEKVPYAKQYFLRFLTFLGTEFCITHWYYDKALLLHEEFLNALRNQAYFLSLVGTNKYLLNILQIFVDMLSFFIIRNEFKGNQTILNFNLLQHFYRARWNIHNCISSCISGHIFEEVLIIMDFLLWDSFNIEFVDEYVKVCKDISKILTDISSKRNSKTCYLQRCILPFYAIDKEDS